MVDFEPGQSITIFGQEFIFCRNPFATGFKVPLSMEGKKATVYQLEHLGKKQLFALKIFKPQYRLASIVANTQRLKLLDEEGLTVCKRSCITLQNNPDLVKNYPEIEFALLMPWIEGCTWYDIVLGKYKISPENSLKFATEIFTLLANLETQGYAHCDISGPNVIFGCEIANNEVIPFEPLWIELIDVEDMFGPGFPEPSGYPAGTDGYQHKESRTSTKGQWKDTGDRFSGAILATEVLCWCDPEFRHKHEGKIESFFAPTELQNPESDNYKFALSVLESVAGQKARTYFEKAWESTSLDKCPSVTDWCRSLKDSRVFENQLRMKLKTARKKGKLSEIIRIAREIQENNYLLSKDEWKAYSNAHRKNNAQQHLEEAILAGDDLEILTAYDNNIAKTLDSATLDRINLAQNRIEQFIILKRAIDANDDISICEFYDKVTPLQKGYFYPPQNGKSLIQ